MTQSSRRSDKKSETLEVRISHRKKTDFAKHCCSQGVTVSDAIWSFIDAELTLNETRPWFDRERMQNMTALMKSRPKATIGSLVAAVTALSIGLAAPSAASDGRAVFDGLDSNGDGLVERTEFVDAIVLDDYALSVPSEAGELQAVSTRRLTGAAHVEFERYDSNEDSYVTFAEFSGRYLARMEYAFAWLDDNQDGSISVTELSVSFGGAGAAAAVELVEELDSNGDDRLTYDEFIEKAD